MQAIPFQIKFYKQKNFSSANTESFHIQNKFIKKFNLITNSELIY